MCVATNVAKRSVELIHKHRKQMTASRIIAVQIGRVVEQRKQHTSVERQHSRSSRRAVRVSAKEERATECRIPNALLALVSVHCRKQEFAKHSKRHIADTIDKQILSFAFSCAVDIIFDTTVVVIVDVVVAVVDFVAEESLPL